MNIVIASILTLFLNKQDKNKVLACILICYLTTMNLMLYLKVPILQDYLDIYTVLTLGLLLSLIIHTDLKLFNIAILFVVVMPHLYYLLILYKPYLLSSLVPMWWLFSTDSILTYSVFFILYEQANDLKFKGMQFKDFMLNGCIVLSLFLF